jgi:type I restriction enzyme R subunit
LPHDAEADARAKIDMMLLAAGWNITDLSQIRREVHVPGIGAEGEYGHADYVLYDSHGRALAVIEAKKTSINPYTAKTQALTYAQNLNAKYIFLSNGELTYFWDFENEDARLVAAFFSQRDLERLAFKHSEKKPLSTIPIPTTYSRSGEHREVRDYQQNAMSALDHAFTLGKRRFLIELPTGTGKTDLVCLYLKRFFAARWCERVLILVDREQLAEQMLGSVQDILSDHSSYWLRSGMQRQEQQITVALMQTMVGQRTDYTAGYFDVVITDECHRSIFGAWQPALTHFDAIHIGLTATPAAYVDRNTFEFFQCKDGKPDFSYPIQEAFEKGYLSPYVFAEGVTELIAEGAEVDGEEYDPSAFEREWTNEKTNRLMMEEFDRLAHENYLISAPYQKEAPGKAIVFAITKHHAARLCLYLNELHPEHQGRYAEIITSDIPDASDAIRRFRKETLPMVGVSVNMLDTGFDLREVLHLVMARRVRSPILYQQMRGRGTRKAPHIGKQRFVIYDFFRNHEYFEDTGWETSGAAGGGGGGTTTLPPPPELIELGLEDEWYINVSYVEVGAEGERIDKREYVTNWVKTVQQRVDVDPILRKVREGAPLSEAEEHDLAQRLNTPTLYFNEENLRRAYKSPSGSLVDFVRAALGLTKVKSREQRVTELFSAWLIAKGFDPDKADYLTLLKHRGVVHGQVAVDDLFEPPLSLQDAGNRGVELFGEDGLREVVSEMNETVFQKSDDQRGVA